MLALFKTLGRSRRIIVQLKEKVLLWSFGLTNKNIPVKRACLPGFSWFRMSLFCGAGSQPIGAPQLLPSVVWSSPPEAPVSAIQLQLPLTHFTFPSMAVGSFRIHLRRTAESCTASRTVMGGDCTDYYGLFCSSKKSEQQKKKDKWHKLNSTGWWWWEGGKRGSMNYVPVFKQNDELDRFIHPPTHPGCLCEIYFQKKKKRVLLPLLQYGCLKDHTLIPT